MQMPQPTADHEWLLQLVGQWEFISECSMGPGLPPAEHTGKQRTRALGSLWTLGEMESDGPDGKPMTSLMSIGFDTDKNRFVGTFISSCMTRLWSYEGQLDAARRVLTLDTLGPSFAGDGSMAKYQDMIEVLGPDEYILSSRHQNPDSTWTNFMSATYKRIGGA